MDILKQLEEGKPFSGRNGAFTGRVEPITIVKTYVKGNIRYWEECTPSGITALTGLVWF